MPRVREGVGKALRRALGEEVVIPRIEPRKPGVSHLLNSRRLRIFQAIFNEPGIHLRDLQRSMGIPLQSLRWHISVLMSSGIIQGVSVGKKIALMSPISMRDEELVLRATQRDTRFASVLRIIESKGEVSVRQIVKETGSYQQLVSARLKAFKSLGLVKSSGKGSGTRYSGGPTSHTAGQEGDSREKRDALLALLKAQGLAPKVRQFTGRHLTLHVEAATEDLELRFEL